MIDDIDVFVVIFVYNVECFICIVISLVLF